MTKLIFCLLLVMADPGLAIDRVKTQIRPQTIHSKVQPSSFSGQHILVNVFLPKTGMGPIKIEVHNNVGYEVGLLEFDLQTLSNFGSVELGSINPKTFTQKVFQVDHTRGLKLKDFTVFDSDANQRFPRLLVQFIRP